MNVRKKQWIAALCVLIAAAAVSACSVVASPMTVVDIQAEIDKAVQATVIAMQVEQQLADSSPEPTATATEVPPTATPLPTATATATDTPSSPTNTPPPTATLVPQSGSNPVIWADANTNCRLGPSRAYKVDGYLLVNEESTVHGRDDGKDWWYIANPTKDDKYCWVWDETTNVEGDTSSVPVVTPPPPPKQSYNWQNYGCYSYYGCPIGMKIDGKYNKWYDLKVCGCGKYEFCEYPKNCWSKNVSDCCKEDLKKFCKKFCWPNSCKNDWRYIGQCQPTCCKW